MTPAIDPVALGELADGLDGLVLGHEIAATTSRLLVDALQPIRDAFDRGSRDDKIMRTMRVLSDEASSARYNEKSALCLRQSIALLRALQAQQVNND